MMENTKKPAIRFKGYTEAWEQRKAKEICSIGTGKSNTQDQVDDGKYPFYIRSDVPVRSNKYLYDCEAVITIGDGNIGKVFHYVNGKFDLHQRCYKMTDFKDIWGKYFFYYFSTKFYDRAMKMTAKATVDSVRLEMISEMDIKKPPQISEQKQIAEFFANLDNLITLHQRKCDRLQNVKKSMLEKMFPKSGSKFPEIRFKGFTEAWEQRKLGEVCSISSGVMGNSLLTDGKYRLTRIETISEGVVDETRVGYTNFRPDDSYLLNEGDVLYSNINSITHMGKVAKYKGNSTLYHGINLLRLAPKDGLFSNFLLYLLNTESKRNWARAHANQAVSQASINQTLLGSQHIMICGLEEQKEIGRFLSDLDNLITLHQRKLEKLKNIKKSMLEKMFV
ncbi:restriction endonuclease subunit S [Acidaminobacterium chupaoyuni]